MSRFKQKEIYLYWYKIKEGNGNFGDELNYYLVSKLSGCKVKHVIIPSSGIDYIYKSLSFVYYKVIKRNDYPKLLRQFFLKDFVVGIGSVISVPNSAKARIWGSGIVKKDDKISKGLFYAVRGKYTQKRLQELGFKAPEAIGDPALLLPLVYIPKTIKKYQIGVIPHYIHYESIKEKIKNDKIKIINLTNSIEQVIEEIYSCEYTISTSLHGIIVSQAYGIPSLWYTYSNKKLFGDNVKFCDYFSSVGIKEYQPLNLLPDEIDIEDILNSFKNLKKFTLINIQLDELLEKLLKVAPFNVLDKFKSWL